MHNLGYAGTEREAYPWVAELSADDATYAAARRRGASRRAPPTAAPPAPDRAPGRRVPCHPGCASRGSRIALR